MINQIIINADKFYTSSMIHELIEIDLEIIFEITIQGTIL